MTPDSNTPDCDTWRPSYVSCAVQAHKRKLAQLRGAMSRLPWKWIALALCLAALAGAAYHYRHPLAQRFHQVELQARSQLANSKAHIQGPIYKKARAWEHSLRQGFHQQRYRIAFCRPAPVLYL